MRSYVGFHAGFLVATTVISMAACHSLYQVISSPTATTSSSAPIPMVTNLASLPAMANLPTLSPSQPARQWREGTPQPYYIHSGYRLPIAKPSDWKTASTLGSFTLSETFAQAKPVVVTNSRPPAIALSHPPATMVVATPPAAISSSPAVAPDSRLSMPTGSDRFTVLPDRPMTPIALSQSQTMPVNSEATLVLVLPSPIDAIHHTSPGPTTNSPRYDRPSRLATLQDERAVL